MRGPAPDLLVRDGEQIARAYVNRRLEKKGHEFRWPPSLYEAVRQALGRMTQEHCAYCDGSPLGATGREEIDHFRPKSRSEFCALVCTWENLFLVCTVCNFAKRETWDEVLLRPDDADFTFERYFIYRFDSDEIHPNPAAGLEDQHRARRTIEILDLNRSAVCRARRRMIGWIRRLPPNEREDIAYRYLIPLCG